MTIIYLVLTNPAKNAKQQLTGIPTAAIFHFFDFGFNPKYSCSAETTTSENLTPSSAALFLRAMSSSSGSENARFLIILLYNLSIYIILMRKLMSGIAR